MGSGLFGMTWQSGCPSRLEQVLFGERSTFIGTSAQPNFPRQRPPNLLTSGGFTQTISFRALWTALHARAWKTREHDSEGPRCKSDFFIPSLMSAEPPPCFLIHYWAYPCSKTACFVSNWAAGVLSRALDGTASTGYWTARITVMKLTDCDL